jgi:hypothetical protein
MRVKPLAVPPADPESGVSGLLPQPGRLQGPLPDAIHLPANNLPVSNSHEVRHAGHNPETAALPSGDEAKKDEHSVIADCTQCFDLTPPGVEGGDQDFSSPLDVRVSPPGQVARQLFRCPHLDLGVDQVEGVLASASERVIGLSDNLDIRLRHRPPSIPHLGRDRRNRQTCLSEPRACERTSVLPGV